MSDTKKETDPTKDPKFKRVIDHFLKTPPKPRKATAELKTAKNKPEVKVEK